MNKRLAVIAAVFTAAVLGLIWKGGGETLQSIAAIPLAASMVAALYEVLRDHATYERTLLSQDHEHRFMVGASSHMADVAFDKHVEFCEEYIGAVWATLHTINREGPSEQALKHAESLREIQKKYVLWISGKTEQILQPFQQALRDMGASAAVARMTIGQQDPTRPAHIARMYKRLAEVTGMKEWDGEELSDDFRASAIIHHLREVLGAEDLCTLRTAILERACTELTRNPPASLR